jgi:hypothetical protein
MARGFLGHAHGGSVLANRLRRSLSPSEKCISVFLYSEIMSTVIRILRIFEESTSHAAHHPLAAGRAEAEFRPPGGRHAFHAQGVDITRAKRAFGVFSQQNAADGSAKAPKNRLFGVDCALKTADFTLWPVAVPSGAALSVITSEARQSSAPRRIGRWR